MLSIYVGCINRMVSEHGESVNFDYMHRFAKIFNKLKQL